jgi:hypothetical protein
MVAFWVVLLTPALALAQGDVRPVEPAEGETAAVEVDAFEAPIEEVGPDDFSQQQQSLILLDSVVYEHSWWASLDVGGSIYDPRRDVLIARWSPALSAGRRFDHYGLFATVQLDESRDFTLDTEELRVLNVGVGGEYLNFLGHVRSSLMVGASVLLTRTPIDEPGETGWFIELRPGALRWGLAEGFTLEFTPFGLDVVAPVTKGIPLIIYSFSTMLGVEWCFSQ